MKIIRCLFLSNQRSIHLVATVDKNYRNRINVCHVKVINLLMQPTLIQISFFTTYRSSKYIDFIHFDSFFLRLNLDLPLSMDWLWIISFTLSFYIRLQRKCRRPSNEQSHKINAAFPVDLWSMLLKNASQREMWVDFDELLFIVVEKKMYSFFPRFIMIVVFDVGSVKGVLMGLHWMKTAMISIVQVSQHICFYFYRKALFLLLKTVSERSNEAIVIVWILN